MQQVLTKKYYECLFVNLWWSKNWLEGSEVTEAIYFLIMESAGEYKNRWVSLAMI